MTSVDEFPNTNPCCKMDAWDVDAYFDLQLTPAGSTILTLDNSWGPTSVDLAPAIKAGETITHLLLTDSALQYNREDYGRDGAENGGVDCINGDKLSKIISMKHLKDVGGNAPTGGDVYMFNTAADQFQPYNLQTFIDQTNQSINTLNSKVGELQAGLVAANARIDAAIADYTAKIDNLQTQVATLQTAFNNYQTTTNARLDAIETTVAKPTWAAADAKLAWGNRNTSYNQNATTMGIFTHDPNTNLTGDTRFQ